MKIQLGSAEGDKLFLGDRGQPEIDAGARVKRQPRMWHAEFGNFNMRNFINLFVRDESGASAAEYALILVVVGIAIILGALALGNSIGNAMNKSANCIATGSAAACTTAPAP